MAKATKPVLAEPSQGKAALRVLIVEDETIVGMGLRAQLTKLGHVVAGHAATVAEAREMYREEKPDLVLMDIRLGDADGIELDNGSQQNIIHGNFVGVGAQRRVAAKKSDWAPAPIAPAARPRTKAPRGVGDLRPSAIR